MAKFELPKVLNAENICEVMRQARQEKIEFHLGRVVTLIGHAMAEGEPNCTVNELPPYLIRALKIRIEEHIPGVKVSLFQAHDTICVTWAQD